MILDDAMGLLMCGKKVSRAHWNQGGWAPLVLWLTSFDGAEPRVWLGRGAMSSWSGWTPTAGDQDAHDWYEIDEVRP